MVEGVFRTALEINIHQSDMFYIHKKVESVNLYTTIGS